MATRTISVAGGNWGDIATWDEGIVPTIVDDVVVRADGASGSVTVTVSTPVKTLDFTAGSYNGTFSINASISLNVAGLIKLNSAGICPGPVGLGTLAQTISTSLTSNGKVIACNYSFVSGGYTLTLNDNAIFTGLFTISHPSSTMVITSANKLMTCSGGLSATQRTVTVTNTTIKVTGGVLSGTSNSRYGLVGSGASAYEFDGNVTCAATGPFIRSMSVRILSGTISGGSLSLGGNITITGSLSLPTTSFRMRTSGTLTLDSPFSCGADFNVVNVNLTISGAQTVTLTGTISSTSANSTINPGNCTWVITAPVTINTASGLGFIGDLTLGGGITLIGTGGLSVSAGKTLTVQTAFDSPGAYYLLSSVVSRTPGSKFTLVLDLATTVRSLYVNYTDVDVTGQIIINVFGTTTNSTGIINKTNDEMLSTDPGVANVLYGTDYLIDGVSLVGTFIGKSSSGSIS